MNDEIRYPIGKFQFTTPSESVRRECIAEFRQSPRALRKAVEGLDESRLLSRYREGGWTLAQVVHHLAEADANCYPRMKYALTENIPTVMVAPEDLWAELPDARSALIARSLDMFEAIRMRWTDAWETLTEKELSRGWRHAHFGVVTLDFMLQQYAWHSRHHTAQILSHRSRMGW
jgi:uncharacterized damage-inducible protein DinB